MHSLRIYFTILRRNFWTQRFLLLITVIVFVIIALNSPRFIGKDGFLEVFYDISEGDFYAGLISDTSLAAEYEISNLPELHRSVLDNSLILFKEDVFVSVVIENHPKSRPQMKGLGRAGIVYEALAEGGVTRFLAVFSYQNLHEIGPVRSARPYFVQLSQSYSGGFAHAGGSPQALSLIPQTRLVNLEGLYYEEIKGGYFFRDTDNYAPHNLFADLVKLKLLVKEKTMESISTRPFFNFLDERPWNLSSQDVRQVVIDFSDSEFKAIFSYNSELNRYLRFLAGARHIDSIDFTQITPANVIVIIAQHTLVDAEGRLEIGVIGKGKAFVFTRGTVFNGLWKKENALSHIKFYSDEDKEIFLSSGQTWIAIIDNEKKLSIN